MGTYYLEQALICTVATTGLMPSRFHIHELVDQPKCNGFFALFTRLDSRLPIISVAQSVSASEEDYNDNAHGNKEITGNRVLFP